MLDQAKDIMLASLIRLQSPTIRRFSRARNIRLDFATHEPKDADPNSTMTPASEHGIIDLPDVLHVSDDEIEGVDIAHHEPHHEACRNDGEYYEHAAKTRERERIVKRATTSHGWLGQAANCARTSREPDEAQSP